MYLDLCIQTMNVFRFLLSIIKLSRQKKSIEFSRGAHGSATDLEQGQNNLNTRKKGSLKSARLRRPFKNDFRTKQNRVLKEFTFYSARYRARRKHQILLTLAPRATFFCTALQLFFFTFFSPIFIDACINSRIRGLRPTIVLYSNEYLKSSYQNPVDTEMKTAIYY